MKAVIMAGGKGTRLGSLSKDTPKPMISVCGKPVIAYQIENLVASGVTEIILVIGHLGHVIRDFVGTGEQWGIPISYLEETTPLGTGGAIPLLKPRIKEDFILLFGDIFVQIDFQGLFAFHQQCKGLCTLFVHPNAHPYDSDLVKMQKNGRVIGWDEKTNDRTYFYKNLVNAGIYVISPDIFAFNFSVEKKDLEKDIIVPFIREGKEIFAYKSSEYAKDMGTLQRLQHVEEDIKQGICQSRQRNRRQKCIFLDRDGTINQQVGFLSKPEEFVLYEGVSEAIGKINRSQYICIVVTNQPVIARGECTVEGLDEIHKKMETLLGNQGAYLDDLYVCPHHTDKGFEGEIPELKFACSCRKPNIGLFQEAKEKYSIDFANSYMIGDSTLDIEGGKRAGLKTILVMTGEKGQDQKYEVQPDRVASDLLQAVNYILNHEEGTIL